MNKNTVCFTIEKSIADQLKKISESKGPSNARMIENAVEDYLKNKKPSGLKPDNEKKQLSFYPSDETLIKLKLVAQEEGRSVSNLVSHIVKNSIMETNKDDKK